MRGILYGVALASLVCVGAAARAGDDAPAPGPKGKGAKLEALFEKLDANHDGKLSREEFAKLAELRGGKLKDHPDRVEKLFNRLDANGDRFLSLDEFRKLAELRQKAREKAPGGH